MVAYMKRVKALRKKVDCLCATKCSKKKHPIFARIEDNAYWQRQCERARDALEELEELFDNMPIILFKSMEMPDLLRAIETDLRGFPIRPPRILSVTDLSWEIDFDGAAPDNMSHLKQQPTYWGPLLDVPISFPNNPNYITQQEIDHGLPDEFFLQHGKEVHFVDEFSPVMSQQ